MGQRRVYLPQHGESVTRGHDSVRPDNHIKERKGALLTCLLPTPHSDSLWYFLLIFACDMVCSLIWLKGPDSLLQAVVGFGLVIPSVAGSHLLLNLREAYYHPSDSEITTANSTGWTVSAFKGGKKRTPTFGRSKNIVASGGRHHVSQLDTRWALDPDQVYVTLIFCLVAFFLWYIAWTDGLLGCRTMLPSKPNNRNSS
jgi:hypothetical protein